MINQDEDMKMSFRYIFTLNFCRGLLDHKLFLNIIAFNWSECAHSLIIFLWTILSSLHWFIIWSSLPPPADLNTVCFPSQSPLYCPQVVNFSRNVEKCWCHSCQGFYKFARCSSLTIFLVLESNLIFQRSCLFKSNCWNEIRKMSVFESIFENQVSSVKDPTHAIQNIQSFDCLVF
jgi:hypothetical protein